jgi:hypothetical protein
MEALESAFQKSKEDLEAGIKVETVLTEQPNTTAAVFCYPVPRPARGR